MDLLALADFNLVARHGSFGEAARVADRPKATLSRRVAELENSLSLRLFERGSRGVKLTQEGRALYERTGALLAELADSASAIAAGSERPRGRLRISAPMLFSQFAMGKLVATFALRYPDVRLEVTTEDRPVDMIEEGYDLVIRVNPDPDESLIGRVFLRDRLVVIARPELPRPGSDAPAPAVGRGATNTRPVLEGARPAATAWHETPAMTGFLSMRWVTPLSSPAQQKPSAAPLASSLRSAPAQKAPP